MDAYRSDLAVCNWYGWFFYRLVCPKLWEGNGALLAVIQTTKVQSSSSPALGPLSALLCGSQQALCRVWDSKSLQHNYLVSWSELMSCVWLLRSHTTQICNRVFGFFYVLDQGLCIILCLRKDLTHFAQSIFSTILKHRHKIKDNICCPLESYGLIHIY